MLFFNPPRGRTVKHKRRKVSTMKSIRRHGKKVSRKAWKASGYSRNPKRKRRKLAGAALAAHRKRLGLGKKRRKSRRATASRNRSKGAVMAKRKRRRATTSRKSRRRRRVAVTRINRNPARRRRRRRGLRRNPFGIRVPSMGGLMKQATQGVMDGAMILVGELATNKVSSLVPFGSNIGIMGAAKKAGVALVIGYGASKALGADKARMIVAGGIAVGLRTLVQSFGVPILNANLGEGAGEGASYAAIEGGTGGDRSMGRYPLASYPDTGLGDGMGDMGDMGF